MGVTRKQTGERPRRARTIYGRRGLWEGSPVLLDVAPRWQPSAPSAGPREVTVVRAVCVCCGVWCPRAASSPLPTPPSGSHDPCHAMCLDLGQGQGRLVLAPYRLAPPSWKPGRLTARIGNHGKSTVALCAPHAGLYRKVRKPSDGLFVSVLSASHRGDGASRAVACVRSGELGTVVLVTWSLSGACEKMPGWELRGFFLSLALHGMTGQTKDGIAWRDRRAASWRGSHGPCSMGRRGRQRGHRIRGDASRCDDGAGRVTRAMRRQ